MYRIKNFEIPDLDEYGHQEFEECGCQFPGVRTVELKLANGILLKAYKTEKWQVRARVGWGAPAYGE